MNRLTASPLLLVLVAGLVFLPGCRESAPPDVVEPDTEAIPDVAPEADTEQEPSPEAQEEEIAEVRDHRLSMDDLRRYGRAAEAVHRMSIDQPELASIEDLEERLARARSLDDVQRVLDQHPGVQQVLRDAGISTRDYVLTGTALLGAYTYVLMNEQGIPDPYRPDYVADEHIRFIEQNREEVDALVGRLQALYEEEA